MTRLLVKPERALRVWKPLHGSTELIQAAILLMVWVERSLSVVDSATGSGRAWLFLALSSKLLWRLQGKLVDQGFRLTTLIWSLLSNFCCFEHRIMFLQNTTYKIFNGFVNFNLIFLLFLFDWNYLLLYLSSRSICPVGDLPVSWSRTGRASLPKNKETQYGKWSARLPTGHIWLRPRDSHTTIS